MHSGEYVLPLSSSAWGKVLCWAITCYGCTSCDGEAIHKVSGSFLVFLYSYIFFLVLVGLKTWTQWTQLLPLHSLDSTFITGRISALQYNRYNRYQHCSLRALYKIPRINQIVSDRRLEEAAYKAAPASASFTQPYSSSDLFSVGLSSPGHCQTTLLSGAESCERNI